MNTHKRNFKIIKGFKKISNPQQKGFKTWEGEYQNGGINNE